MIERSVPPETSLSFDRQEKILREVGTVIAVLDCLFMFFAT